MLATYAFVQVNGNWTFVEKDINVCFGGKLLHSQLVWYGTGKPVVVDRLGSARVQGSDTATYYPYGERRSGTYPANAINFSTYFRDNGTGLDYAMNRYFMLTYSVAEDERLP